MTTGIAPLFASRALAAYQTTQAPPTGSNDFGAALSNALSGAINTSQDAEQLAKQAIGGGSNDLTQVVTAVSKAELALQTTVAIRDRVLQAYQDIIKMPI